MTVRTRAGEGHAHLYINGKKVARVYACRYELPTLVPGEHVVEVGLFTNNHRAYASEGHQVTARKTVLVEP